MAADVSATERAYQQLKRDIVQGALPIGPLDIRALGDRMRMSVTPVREALARLSAERLVRLAPHHGYAVAPIFARQLEELYELFDVLVGHGLERATQPPRPDEIPACKAMRLAGDYANDMDALFQDMIRHQCNAELGEQALGINNRLFLPRRHEPAVVSDCARDANDLQALWSNRNLAALRSRLAAYHQVRIARADTIARLLCD